MEKKIGDFKTFIKLLKSHGFVNTGGTNHDKWVNGKTVIVVPRRNNNRNFHRGLIKKLAKQAGIL